MDELMQALGLNSFSPFGAGTGVASSLPQIPEGAYASAAPDTAPPPDTGGADTGKGVGSANTGFNADKFMQALRGVQMPKPPEMQKITSPHAPTPVALKGGNLLGLLNALNLPAQTAVSQYKLPATLEPPTLGFSKGF